MVKIPQIEISFLRFWPAFRDLGPLCAVPVSVIFKTQLLKKLNETVLQNYAVIMPNEDV
jgi:hypothetical protein